MITLKVDTIHLATQLVKDLLAEGVYPESVEHAFSPVDSSESTGYVLVRANIKEDFLSFLRVKYGTEFTLR